ncbi:Lysophospholipid acyltransferase LPEAT2-like protein [Drosera capensis]
MYHLSSRYSFFYELFPTIVASDSHDSLPAVGTIIRAMQGSYILENAHVSNTGCAIASALNVVQTSHAYGDVMLLMEAAEMKQAYHISSQEAVDFLHKFLSMNPDDRHACELAFSSMSTGESHVSKQDFRDSVRLTVANISDDGSIDEKVADGTNL